LLLHSNLAHRFPNHTCADFTTKMAGNYGMPDIPSILGKDFLGKIPKKPSAVTPI
jgi:hypothetical protein